MMLERHHQELKKLLYSEYLGCNYLLSEEQFSDLSMGNLATVGFLYPAQADMAQELWESTAFPERH